MKENQKLHAWFLAHKRDFPWRQEKTPYRVWISEIMLQQTRASVVVPYFQRWMALFPTVKALAAASQDLVLKAWEGLGYYSRARNLHAAAQQIVSDYEGEIPDSAEKLASIRGIGPYTVGAILSFGFQKRAAAVDGNVARVMTRYFLVEEDISKAKVKRKIAELAENFLDHKEPWVTAEALIELGASLCSPKPRCEDCPLQSGCQGLKAGKMESLPIKPVPPMVTELIRSVFIIEAEGAVLVRKGESGKVMADLYEFPYFEQDEGAAHKILKDRWGIEGNLKKLGAVKHSFTRFSATLFPYKISIESRRLVPGYIWVEVERLTQIPFSSGHRKILHNWLK
ncbi:MAG: A/G-specific adenine glycosylase [Verrucomicrobia bacterium]|nr:A/G-specific adenine glycosylase [Verrucomicrobiota bacterium]